jgi:hypothetical protein
MTRRLIIAGIVITGVGLALLGYLDPTIRVLFFGSTGLGSRLANAGGTANFTRTGGIVGNVTGGISTIAGRGGDGGTLSFLSLATIIVFAATVVGLLLTIAGFFAAGRGMPRGPAPAPAA